MTLRFLRRTPIAGLLWKPNRSDFAASTAAHCQWCRQAGAALLWGHQQVRAELLDLLDVLAARIEHVSVPLTTHSDVPLEVHGRYTRVEILAAFDVGEGAKVAPWQTGVYWASNARADLFAFTLDKTTGQFSPTTRYRDYAISPDLIHWESQSVTRADSDTGRRYQHHATTGSSVMLFARPKTRCEIRSRGSCRMHFSNITATPRRNRK
jgi:hypothetical protein